MEPIVLPIDWEATTNYQFDMPIRSTCERSDGPANSTIWVVMMNLPTIVCLLACGNMPVSAMEIRTLEGDPVVGELKSVASDGSITLTDGRKIKAGDWYSVRNGLLPPWPRSPHVELTNDDRIAGAVIDADGDTLHLRPAIAGEPSQSIRLPLSALRAVWFNHRPTDFRDPVWLGTPRKRDVIQARSGDIVSGAMTGIDAAKNVLRYQSDGKDHQLELMKVFAVGFNTDLARARRPKGPYYRMTLKNGSRLSVTTITFDGEKWSALTPFKETIRMPADQLASVDVEQGKIVYLSDVKPSKYQYQPFDGEEYSWVADRAVTGRPLVLKTPAGASYFDRGVGLHAECSATYSLDSKYRRFEAIVGVDALSGVRGDSILVVLVDGKEQPLPRGGRLTYALGPLALRIDISGAKELTIVLRRQSGGYVQDHVDLAEARLVP